MQGFRARDGFELVIFGKEGCWGIAVRRLLRYTLLLPRGEGIKFADTWIYYESCAEKYLGELSGVII